MDQISGIDSSPICVTQQTTPHIFSSSGIKSIKFHLTIAMSIIFILNKYKYIKFFYFSQLFSPTHVWYIRTQGGPSTFKRHNQVFHALFFLVHACPITSENDLPDFDDLFHMSNSNPVENCRWVFQNKVKNHNTKVNSRPVKGKFSMKIWKTHLPM